VGGVTSGAVRPTQTRGAPRSRASTGATVQGRGPLLEGHSLGEARQRAARRAALRAPPPLAPGAPGGPRNAQHAPDKPGIQQKGA